MVCTDLNISFSIQFLMQDASLAEKQELLADFPNAVIIMCYFDVKKMLRIILGNIWFQSNIEN